MLRSRKSVTRTIIIRKTSHDGFYKEGAKSFERTQAYTGQNKTMAHSSSVTAQQSAIRCDQDYERAGDKGLISPPLFVEHTGYQISKHIGLHSTLLQRTTTPHHSLTCNRRTCGGVSHCSLPRGAHTALIGSAVFDVQFACPSPNPKDQHITSHASEKSATHHITQHPNTDRHKQLGCAAYLVQVGGDGGLLNTVTHITGDGNAVLAHHSNHTRTVVLHYTLQIQQAIQQPTTQLYTTIQHHFRIISCGLGQSGRFWWE